VVREESYRLYNCRRCEVAVSICNECDYGNIYCAGECSVQRRRESLRRAGARYQRTRRGAGYHAARQRALRQRRAQKVTHLGCARTGPVVTMSVTAGVAAIEPHDAQSVPDTPLASPRKRDRNSCSVAGHCDFCHAPLPQFTRLRTWRGWGFG
jgi:hypothetical protein